MFIRVRAHTATTMQSILEVTVNTIRQEKQMGGIIIMKEEK